MSSKSVPYIKKKWTMDTIKGHPKARRPRLVGKISGVIRGKVVDGPQGPERKKLDVSVGFTAVGNSAPYLTSLLNNLGQGTDANNRIGDRILVKGMDFQFNITAFSATAPTFIDVFLVWDKQPDGTICSVTDIFNTGTTNLTYQNIQNLERFVVLRRHRTHMDSGVGLSDLVTWHIDLDASTRFPGSTPGYPKTNDYLVVGLCGGIVGGVSGSNLAYTCRVTYTDE